MIKAFISDLHLEAARPPITHLFTNFLTTCVTTPIESLYILGDLFEAWIGDDHRSDFNQLIINHLKQATQQGLKIYLTHGNRDFLIGKKFLSESGCQLLPEEYVLNLFGTPTLLMHGDTLCTEDIAYLKFRKKARNWLVQKLFLMKSLKTREAIVARYRAASQAHTSTTADYLMDVTPKAVENVMSKHAVQYLIHGHTHRPFIHHFQLNGRPAVRTVLGAWHEDGNVLLCKEDGTQEVIQLK